MSTQDRNRMLYILHRNGVNRKNIKFIMNDLKCSSIFDDEDMYEDLSSLDELELGFLEEQAYWLFNSNASNADKINALRSIKIKQDEYEKTKKSQYLLDQEKRILAKRKELIEKGVIKPDPPSPQNKLKITTRYGRSPLHEAVAMRDVRLIEKYLKSGKYLDKVDNNGHTPLEMAYYYNYKEALMLFKRYINSKKAV